MEGKERMEGRSKERIDPELQVFGLFLQVKLPQVYLFCQLTYVTLHSE